VFWTTICCCCVEVPFGKLLHDFGSCYAKLDNVGSCLWQVVGDLMVESWNKEHETYTSLVWWHYNMVICNTQHVQKHKHSLLEVESYGVLFVCNLLWFDKLFHQIFTPFIYILLSFSIFVCFAQAWVTRPMHYVGSMFLFSNFWGWNSDNACQKQC